MMPRFSRTKRTQYVRCGFAAHILVLTVRYGFMPETFLFQLAVTASIIGYNQPDFLIDHQRRSPHLLRAASTRSASRSSPYPGTTTHTRLASASE